MQGFWPFISAVGLMLSSQTAAAMDQQALAQSSERGAQIYAFDQAAWKTTDVLLELIKDPAGAGIRGWVVSPEAKGLRVTYTVCRATLHSRS